MKRYERIFHCLSKIQTKINKKYSFEKYGFVHTEIVEIEREFKHNVNDILLHFDFNDFCAGRAKYFHLLTRDESNTKSMSHFNIVPYEV